jgi:hypothetical protein
VVIAVSHSGQQRSPLTAETMPEMNSWFSLTLTCVVAVNSQHCCHTGSHSLSNLFVPGVNEMNALLGCDFFHFRNPFTDISSQ